MSDKRRARGGGGRVFKGPYRTWARPVSDAARKNPARAGCSPNQRVVVIRPQAKPK